MPPRNFSPTPDTVEYCRNLIQQGEGVRVEFKTSFQKEVIASLVAFANI
jgi:predicted HTH transcriptional regulator